MTSSIIGAVLAGIAYDPEIRGVLVVAVAASILCGSVYLLLSTNIGARLGFQVALAGLLGWMMLLSLFWSIYGVGAIGELPEWHVDEVNIGNIAEAETESARSLVPENLPAVDQILTDHPEIAEQFEAGDTPTLSEIAALPGLPEDVADQFEGLADDWAVLPQTELGDAQAAADAALTGDDVGLYDAATEYVVIGGFDRGGKPQRQSDSLVDRAINRVTNTLRVLNPPKYTVVQVQTSEPTFVPEGNAPLSPVADPDEPVVSVIMVRDLGTRRLPPIMLTALFGFLFLLTSRMLHTRDRRAEALSTPLPAD